MIFDDARIANEDILVVESNKQSKWDSEAWVFKHRELPEEGKCECCY